MQTALAPIMRDYLIRFQQTAIKETGRRPLTFLRTPLGEKVLPLFSSVIEFLGKVVFVLVFIPRFAYNAVILCEPVVWCFMALYLVAVYRCNPFVFPKKQ